MENLSPALLSILGFVYKAVVFIIVLSILVVIHEWGHFIIARKNGVRVHKFSIGFGPRLFGRKIGDTEFVVSAIPLGGYVKMAGENPDEIENKPDEFASKTVWQRAQVVIAGPIMNLVLAFALMPLVFLIGTKIPAFLEKAPRVAWVEENSPAQKAGIRQGDMIKQINGHDTPNWEKVIIQVSANPGLNIEVTADRDGREEKFNLVSQTDEDGIGLAGFYPEERILIANISKGAPAEGAGIQKGDIIVSVNGTPIHMSEQFMALIRKSGGSQMELELERNGTMVKTSIVPAFNKDTKAWMIGVMLSPAEAVYKRYGVIESVQKGFQSTWELTVLTFDVLKKLLTFQLSIKSLGGPVMIGKLVGQAASSGLTDLIRLMAFISLQLGIMNLLPIPVLDGGWMVFLGIEAVIRRPLSRKGMEVAQFIGFMGLMLLFLVVTYHDIGRLFSK